MNNSKYCKVPDCLQNNPQDINQFSKQRDAKDGRRNICKSCARLRYKEYVSRNKEIKTEWYKNNKQSVLDRSWKNCLKKFYNLSVEEYNNILLKQNNVCKICQRKESVKDPRENKIRRLSVDHDHTTGKIRGLLCYECNVSLGKFGDNIERLETAIKYLKGEL